MKSLQFTINGVKFWVDEFKDGFAWVSGELEGECFPTQLEAQQDAMNNEIEHIKATEARLEIEGDEREYGTHEQQAEAFYRSECL